MSNLPISSKYVSTPDKPVDERERESVVARVNAAFEGGQLDDLDYRRFLDLASPSPSSDPRPASTGENPS